MTDQTPDNPIASTPENSAATRRGFVKGISGNPGGRPRAEREVRELARRYTAPAIRRLAQLMRSSNDRVAVAACSALLDRAWGKPAQALTGPNGAPLMPQVLIGLMTGEPITDAIRAAQAYQAICGNPNADLDAIVFEAPSPSPLEELLVESLEVDLVPDVEPAPAPASGPPAPTLDQPASEPAP